MTPLDGDLSRLAQLVAKTNQFNLNARRRSESELAALCASQDYIVRLTQVKDRFGDYGIVGVAILKLADPGAELDTFVLSCRALGRGIEEAMMANLFEQLAPHGQSEIRATVEESPRNEPACRFFAGLGCETTDQPYSLRPVAWPAYLKRS